MLFSQVIHTPLGVMLARTDGIFLISLDFSTLPREDALVHHPILDQTEKELGEYFSGKRKGFDIALAPEGTDFQKSAWKGLTQIPYGETRNYTEQALLAGSPKAIRAIGGANNKNPILIIIPCHRVIGKSGNLVGYRAGLEKKQWLLDHETKYMP